ncbi:hypothetical protein [Actinoplanes sp. HUAS TT8]|uniref:hypothetical protein n=1 Tax=Actinoplanes sp. HUAS TT8 TaxID=3447453 RepID=UPI003F5264AA
MLDRFAVRLSPSAPYPQVRALVEAAAAGDWPGLRRLADAAEPQARTRLLRMLAEHHRFGDLAARAVEADPDDSTAAATRAFQLIHQGWLVRGDGRARNVSARRFAGFHEYLAEAERVLHAALTRSAHDTALWTVSLTTARGLEMGLEHARYRYECLAAFDPHHLPAQSQLLQQLCPKWGGSWPEAERFARAAADAAPAGAHNAVLIADLHLEKLVDQRAGELRSAQVRADLDAAADRSVRHPAFQRTVGWVAVVNSFAMAFGLAGDRAAARRMFALLGPYASELPWVYRSADAATAFRLARLRAYGLSGGVTAATDALLVAASPLIRFVTDPMGGRA